MYKKIFVLFVVLILLISIGGLVAYNQKKLKQNDVNVTTIEENNAKEESAGDEEILGKLIINKINKILNKTILNILCFIFLFLILLEILSTLYSTFSHPITSLAFLLQS